MNKRWIAYGAMAALLALAGCKASDTPSSATDQTQAPGQGAGGNPMNAQTQTAARAPEPPKPVVVPAGTVIPVVLTTSLSSKTNNPGDEFEGSVASPVDVGGEVAIPKDSKVTGTVVNAKAQGAIKGEAILAIRLTRITVHGKSYEVSTSAYTDVQKGKGKRTGIMTGGGAAVGALIGGLAGGGKGAAIGAGVGAGGGLATAAGTGGKNANLPSESRVNFKLTEPVTIQR